MINLPSDNSRISPQASGSKNKPKEPKKNKVTNLEAVNKLQKKTSDKEHAERMQKLKKEGNFRGGSGRMTPKIQNPLHPRQPTSIKPPPPLAIQQRQNSLLSLQPPPGQKKTPVQAKPLKKAPTPNAHPGKPIQTPPKPIQQEPRRTPPPAPQEVKASLAGPKTKQPDPTIENLKQLSHNYQIALKSNDKMEIHETRKEFKSAINAYASRRGYLVKDLEDVSRALDFITCGNFELNYLLSLDSDMLKFVTSVQRDPATKNDWEKYVVRRADWKHSYNDADQVEYGRWMKHTIKIASQGIKEQGWDYPKLMDFLAKRRAIIARHADLSSVNVGRTRDVPYHTFCYGIYQDIFPRRDERALQKKVPPDTLFYSERLGKEILLTTFATKMFSEEKVQEDRKKGIKWNRTLTRDHVIHPEPEIAQEVMKHVETEFYPRVMNETNDKRINNELAEIFWWVCQAKPWYLGDPSIAESFVRTIEKVKFPEKEPRAWKPGLIPWAEVVIKSNVEEFVQGWDDMFD